MDDKITFVAEDVQYEFNNRFFWVRVYEQSNLKEAVAIMGVGLTYLNDFFQIPNGKDFEEVHKNQWLEIALKDLEEELTVLPENGKVYLKVYAYSPEGIENGLNFLKKVTP